MLKWRSLVVMLAVYLSHIVHAHNRPNIILIVADDLGWNDVGFHGSDEIPTPNIDKLAKEGVRLNNYYVLPTCSPSRSALMTGRYPIHTGMHVDTIYAAQAWGLGLDEPFLPKLLKGLGYKSHAVGKWHIGFYAKEYTPRYRGFDSFYGSYLGKADYWDHSNQEEFWGLDLHHDEKPVSTQWGNYSVEMHTSEAEARIRDHDIKSPLFLYLAYHAVHSANRLDDPLQAPSEWVDKFKNIKHKERRTYAAMLSYLDHGVGRVVDALRKRDILRNSVIIFTTDNGGPANGFNYNWANNYPLRGGKGSLYQGGVRGVGLVYSPFLNNSGRICNDLMHITDWLPTLITIAGGSIPKENIDGFDQWNTLRNGKESPRTEVLLNIDEESWYNEALIIKDWKIIKEGIKWKSWYAPPNFKSAHLSNLTVQCNAVIPTSNVKDCYSDTKHGYCLFNLKYDPCEIYDLSKYLPKTLNILKMRMEDLRMSMIQSRRNTTLDPLANPKLSNGVWEPWITL